MELHKEANESKGNYIKESNIEIEILTFQSAHNLRVDFTFNLFFCLFYKFYIFSFLRVGDTSFT